MRGTGGAGRENASVKHLLRDRLGGKRDGDGDGLALADFVFEDTQCFIQRVDEEVNDTGVHCMTERDGLGGGSERGNAADVAGDGEGAAGIISSPV